MTAPLRLRVHKAPLTETPPQPILLVGGPISIGRRDDNGWVLPDSTASVSRKHATVEERNGIWLLTDESANGTLHNGQIVGRGNARPIAIGDIIQIGDYEVIIETAPDMGGGPRPGMPMAPPVQPLADPYGIGDFARADFGAPPPPPSGPSPFDPPAPERQPEAPRNVDLFGDFAAHQVAPDIGMRANPDAPAAAFGSLDGPVDPMGQSPFGGPPGGAGSPFGAPSGGSGGAFGGPSPAGGDWGLTPDPARGAGPMVNDPFSNPGGGSVFGDQFGSADAIRNPLAGNASPGDAGLKAGDPFSAASGPSVFGNEGSPFGNPDPVGHGREHAPAAVGFDVVAMPEIGGPGANAALPSDWNAQPAAGSGPLPVDLDPIEQALAGLKPDKPASAATGPAQPAPADALGMPGAGLFSPPAPSSPPPPSSDALFGAPPSTPGPTPFPGPGPSALAPASASPLPASQPPLSSEALFGAPPSSAQPFPGSGSGGPAAPALPPQLPGGDFFGNPMANPAAPQEDAFAHPSMPAPAAPAQPRHSTPVGTPSAPPAAPSAAFQPRPAPQQPAPRPAPAPSPAAPPQAAAAGGDALLRAFMEGAGLQQVPPDLDPMQAMRTLGASSRAIVSTLARLLEARRLLKGEFRITQTVVGARENNPLKFSVDESELMLVLLGSVRPGFQRGEAAVWDAGRDLEAHQLAMLSAFRAVLDAVFARLSPDSVASGEEAGFFGRLLPQARDAAMWERYIRMYGELRQDIGNTLAGRLGQIFAEAYEAENGRRGGSR